MWIELYVLHAYIANLLTFNIFLCVFGECFLPMYMDIKFNTTQQTVGVWDTYNVPVFWQFINPACIISSTCYQFQTQISMQSTGILNACVYRIPVGVYFLVTVHVNIPCKAMVKCHLRWAGKTDKASKVVVLMALSILSH